jgi:hypothetical protein
MTKNDDVLIITGAGGIGQAIARRQGPGKHVLFADVSQDNLGLAAAALEDLGHRVSTQGVDVSARESVHALARRPPSWATSPRSSTRPAFRLSRRPRRRSSPSTCSAPPWCWRSSAA